MITDARRPFFARRRGALGACIVAAAFVVGGCVAAPPSSDAFELRGPLTNPEMPLHESSRAGLAEATATVCGAIRCEEAWESDAARYLRFDDVGSASDYASAVPGALADRYVVIEFAPGIGRAMREDILNTVLIQLPSAHAPWGF